MLSTQPLRLKQLEVINQSIGRKFEIGIGPVPLIL